MPAPKLGDIAKRAGVSIAAVSITINNPETNRVSAAKRKLILDIASELNYSPNEVAKAFAERRTKLVGLMVPLKDPIFFNHFIAQVLSGIQATLMQRGYNLLIYSPTGKPGRETHDQILESRFTDGLIFINTRLCSNRDVTETIRELDAAKIPFSMVNSYYGRASINYVGVDDCAIGREAYEYLLGRGYRRIAFLSGLDNLPTHIQLLKGMRTAAEHAGVPLRQERTACTGYVKEEAFRVLDRWFGSKSLRPDAIFCGDDQLLVHMYDYVEARGLKIPDDVAVLGRGNGPLLSFLRPTPTAFVLPTFEMGKVAAEMLIDSIEDPQHKKQKVMLPYEWNEAKTT